MPHILDLERHRRLSSGLGLEVTLARKSFAEEVDRASAAAVLQGVNGLGVVDEVIDEEAVGCGVVVVGDQRAEGIGDVVRFVVTQACC